MAQTLKNKLKNLGRKVKSTFREYADFLKYRAMEIDDERRKYELERLKRYREIHPWRH